MTRTVKRGDTIVEVIIAFAVMSAVILSISTLMGMGLNIAQRSLETSLVRQQIDTQANLLRYAQDQNSSLWRSITSDDLLTATAATTVTVQSGNCSAAPDNSFALYYDKSAGEVRLHSVTDPNYYEEPVTYSFVSDDGIAQGMWIQVVKAEGSSNVAAYDFYIRGCWYSGSSTQPVSIGTIVRLYGR